MTINVKCNKCGETGVRKDQDELKKNRKCKACGGDLTIQKGSVLDVPIESLVKSGMKQVGGMLKKKTDDNEQKIANTFVDMQTTLSHILTENIKQTNILKTISEKIGGSA